MTTTAPIPTALPPRAERIRYGALIVLMLMGFLLVTAEFLPNGVLTEMADELGVTPGQAGQTVTVTALVGLIVAPTVGLMFPRLDRRSLLVWMALAAAVSNLIVAISPNLIIILLARFLLGAAISAFWAMSITVAARLTGPERLGRGVMFTSAGVSLATVAGVPLGVMLSELVDWRMVFAIAGVLMVLLAVALRLSLPSVPAAQASSLRLLVDTLRRPGIGLGMIGHILVVLGHFSAYTYVRLALERIPDVDASTIVVLLALFGLGGLAGNITIGLVIDRSFAFFAVFAPLVIAAAVISMILLSGTVVGVAIVVLVWGFFFSSWLIVANTWVGHRMPDRLEAGGSLVVVGFQAAIMIAAGVGGLLVDTLSVELVYVIGAVSLIAGAAFFGASNRVRA
ncbi:MFS transporter [Microbacterium saperdae]|uniref:Putative MFS family arabinose efflux permease n=1 Tax=Microbacterium saperdae TaxID=69368 RepID=A0A543B9N8_9MICO|nr:MFS transporter [Microbacterium saperdae]TQL81538.1 putative MFS family arabinose efflux permease [Microbacterium saperdae]GGM59635.1 MFS transporter [Microbacterium saperdae]